MYVATTFKGLEDICAKEVKGKILADRLVVFKKVKTPKSANSVFKLIDKFNFSSIDDIVKNIKKKKITLRKKFSVACNRNGEHNFTSLDVIIRVGKALADKKYEFNLKNPENVIKIEIINNLCVFGYLLKDSLGKRPYRVKINNQSISPCIAFSLLKIADYKKTEPLLDPFCKDGVIAIEAALLKGKKIYAFDPVKNNLRNAVINSKLAKVKINFSNLDVTWLDTKFKKNSIDKIVTNMVVSKRNPDIEKNLKEFFNHASYILKKNLVIASNKTEEIKRLSKDYFKLIEERKIMIGKMEYFILKLEKVNP